MLDRDPSVPRRKRSERARSDVEPEPEVLTGAGEMSVDPALDRLHKRMASELQALRGLLKKARLMSRGPACTSGAAPAGKSKRPLAPEPRVEAGGKTTSVKRRKVSPLLDQSQKQRKVPPRMSPDEREQLAGHLAMLAAELPGHILGFLQKRFGSDADPHGEIEIDIHSVEDSALFELKTHLDEFDEEQRLNAGVLPKEEHGSVMMEVDPKKQTDSNLAEEIIRSDVIPEQEKEDIGISSVSESDSDTDSSSSCGSDESSSSSGSDGSSSSSDSDSESDSDEVVDGTDPPAVVPEETSTSAQPPPDPAPEAAQSTGPASVSGADSTTPPALVPETAQPPSSSHRASEVAHIAQPKKVQGVQRAAAKAVGLPGLLFRAKVRRELLEMDKAVLPDETIRERDLRRLCIDEYGRPDVMRQLGLFLKADGVVAN